MGRVMILSGPSCVGKSPLFEGWRRCFPQSAAKLQKYVLFHSRAPRPGERDGIDYHFRSAAEIEALRGHNDYFVFQVRQDVQALHLPALAAMADSADVFLDLNPFAAIKLSQVPCWRERPLLRIFLSPLSQEEIGFLLEPDRHIDMQACVAEIMRRKLLWRTHRQKNLLALADLEDIERRAASAYAELQQAHRFDYVLVNHDGEGHDHWQAFGGPLGDARKVIGDFQRLWEGQSPLDAEHWPASLIPD